MIQFYKDFWKMPASSAGTPEKCDPVKDHTSLREDVMCLEDSHREKRWSL